MVITGTDDGEDGWVDFEDSAEGVGEIIRGLVHDEWGLSDAWDLDRESLEPLRVTVTVSIGTGSEGSPNG